VHRLIWRGDWQQPDAGPGAALAPAIPAPVVPAQEQKGAP
jgi:hypothetical protein